MNVDTFIIYNIMTDEEKYFEQLLSTNNDAIKAEPITHKDREVPYRDITVIKRTYSNGKKRYYYFGCSNFNNGLGYYKKEDLYQTLYRFLKGRLHDYHKQGLMK